jgi:anaerobic selenocysteine-containing dehydrogenase
MLKPAMIIGGLGVSQHSAGVQTGRAIQSLSALTGNMNVKGGNLFFPHPLESLAGPASLIDRLKDSTSWQRRVVELSTERMDSNRLWDLILADGRDTHWREYIFRTAFSEKGDPFSRADAYPGVIRERPIRFGPSSFKEEIPFHLAQLPRKARPWKE